MLHCIIQLCLIIACNGRKLNIQKTHCVLVSMYVRKIVSDCQCCDLSFKTVKVQTMQTFWMWEVLWGNHFCQSSAKWLILVQPNWLVKSIHYFSNNFPFFWSRFICLKIFLMCVMLKKHLDCTVKAMLRGVSNERCSDNGFIYFFCTVMNLRLNELTGVAL